MSPSDIISAFVLIVWVSMIGMCWWIGRALVHLAQQQAELIAIERRNTIIVETFQEAMALWNYGAHKDAEELIGKLFEEATP